MEEAMELVHPFVYQARVCLGGIEQNVEVIYDYSRHRVDRNEALQYAQLQARALREALDLFLDELSKTKQALWSV